MPVKDKICPVCNNLSVYKLTKQTTQYHECTNCKMLFSEPLNQEGLVGGGAEIERNTQQNHLRIERISQMLGRISKDAAFVADWGCGTGYLIEDLKAAGYVNSVGYDLYNPKFEKLPEKGRFDVVVSVECFEHMHHPYTDIKGIYRSLKPGGYCYIETGFLNAAWEEGLSDEDNQYINPAAGHSTIWTHHALDLIMSMNSFIPVQKFNRHAHCYIKK